MLKAYISAPVKSLLISGEVWLSQLWVGDTLMAADENADIQYCIPKEGCEVWDDNLAIPKTAPHKYTAEVWMNYCLRPEVAAAISNFVHYATPVEAAKKYIDPEDLNNPGIYPLARGHEAAGVSKGCRVRPPGFTIRSGPSSKRPKYLMLVAKEQPNHESTKKRKREKK